MSEAPPLTKNSVRDPNRREAKRAQIRSKITEKRMKKEAQIWKQLQRGVKKAINFEVGKLKRRIKVLLEAENPSASQNKDQAEGGTGPQKVQACPDEAEVGATSGREDEAGNRLSKRLKYEKGTAASLTKQLQVAQKVSLQRVAYLAGKELGLEYCGAEDSQEVASAADDAPSEEDVQAFTQRVLGRKAVKAEMEEGKKVLDVLKATSDKWETKLARGDRRAIARAAKQEKLALEGGNDPDPSREEESKQKKVPAQKPRLTQAEGTKKRKKKRLQKKLDRLRVKRQKKEQNEERSKRAKLKVQQRKMKRTAGQQGGAGTKAPSEVGNSNAASNAAGPLHPSWAAKKQQQGMISQAASKGKKTVFNE